MDQTTFSPTELDKRQAIIEACLDMNRLGINQGTSGNISVRHEDYILITPTSTPYEKLTTDSIVRLEMDGTAKGPLAASSEWRFHRDIMLARPDVNAIVHAHPTYSTILAIMGLPIPPIHYMIAVAGGDDIRCAPYATFGSQTLSEKAVAALEGRKACLLEHHGIIAVGATLSKALWLSVEVETLAKQYHGALQLGEPRLLSKEEIARVLEKMGSYGHKD
ncbi:class II aldolase/adducin family protein [Rhizobium sp. TRM96647]|uniref:class II aldolase/adducin family protein n=1 Tax=unclassified Rhizobium TaxID=2613769 RepID=UPI0021E7B9DD|nr:MULTISPECIES: class II aldolase/adducin family protein [unclassified Rhizobium]MCV3739205.1 class II aldolase/adducin family protein [Rhizobium sp. TRM96647]MCV3760917.1 class II aldolase/adducin family protein [Rhizobium sp. TRM96650]